MEMKINFDQLFDSSQELNSTFQLPSSQIDASYHTSLNHSFQYKFTFDKALFDRQAEESNHIKLIEDQSYQEEVKSVQTKKSTKTKQSVTSARPSQPGQRLYYQSQESEIRKNKERERIQKEKVAELKSMPFAPTINKKSRKLAQKVKTEPKQQIKGKIQARTTQELKDQQVMKECTFQPKLIAKNTKVQPKSKEQLFYYLHNTSKIKEMKMNRKTEQEFTDSKMKKVSKQVFIQFLKRNDEYNNVIKKKHEIMKQKAENYDLKTGQKLFSPKISDLKSENLFQKNASAKNILISPKTSQPLNNTFKSQTHKKPLQQQPQKPKLKSSIFAKKARNDNYQPKKVEENSQFIVEKPLKSVEKEEEYYSQQYRKYSQQFDRRTAELREGSLSHHEVIPQESQHSFHQIQKCESQTVKRGEKNVEQDYRSKFLQQEVVESLGHMWNSHQIRPFELSNVNQYLNASEEDEPEPRNNYVMDILNNLMGARTEEE